MKKHITPVVLAVIRKGDKFLLTKRVEKDEEDSQLEFNNLWQIPGGGLEFGESVEDGIYRECREELGSTVRIVKMIPQIFHRVYNDYWHGLFMSFVCELVSPESEIVLNEEASEWQWFAVEEIKKLNKFPHMDEIYALASK